MRFLRHLVAAMAVVTIVVALGFGLKHSPAAGLIADDHGGIGDRRPPAGAPIDPRRTGGNGPAGDRGPRGPGGFDLGQIGELGQSLAVQAGAVVVVVAVDRRRRRRRSGPSVRTSGSAAGAPG